ncbi:MAG: imidazoleglycerol-phosphate dehydratase, partial [Thermotogaceae bacterium]|nr:imidazoleglycerol-phosphate dehydratase [Thermotogaceae bacterium]
MMRRTTAETDISLALGTEVTTIRLEDPVLAHMLRTLFFYMKKKVFVEARYDLRHHLWEDVGITIG